MCGYMPIIDVYAREILDSTGNPAIEVEIMTEDGTVGRAAVPSAVSGDGYGAVAPGISADGHGAAAPGNLRDGHGTAPGNLRDGHGVVASGNLGNGCGAEPPDVSETCHLMNSALADVVIGENVYEQASIDRLLHRKIRDVGSLTRNEICCVSMAVAVTAAKSLCLPLYRYLGGICADRLPIPMVTLLHGVRHKKKPGTEITILSDAREFMIMPTGACTYEKGMRMCMDVCRVFWQILAEQQAFAEDGTSMPAGRATGSVADRTFAGEGTLAEKDGGSAMPLAFADALASVRKRMDIESVLSLILMAVQKAGYQPGKEIALAIDVAADALYEDDSGSYVFRYERKPDECEFRRSKEKMPDESRIGRSMEKNPDNGEGRKSEEKMQGSSKRRKSTEEMIDWLESLCHSFPILSVVDGLPQKDLEGWKKLTRRLDGRVRLVADRLFDADPKGFLDAHREQIAHAVLIKPDRFAAHSCFGARQWI